MAEHLAQRPAAARRRPRWEKVVLGCALGCGIFVVLVGLVVVVGVGWIVSPGRQIATERVVGEDSLGVLRLERSMDDPGVSAFVTRVFLEVQRAAEAQQRREVPENLRWLQELSSARQQNPVGMSLFVPRDLTVSYETGADGQLESVTALNLRAFPRLIRTALKAIRSGEGDEVADYRGQVLTQFRGGGGLAFVGGTLLISDDLVVLTKAIDRVLDGSPNGQPAAALPPHLPDWDPERWDFWGRLDNGGDHQGELLEVLDYRLSALLEPGYTPWLDLPPADSDSITNVVFGLDLRSADELQGELVLDAASAEAADAWQERLEAMFSKSDAGEGEIRLVEARADTERSGNRLTTRIDMTGLEKRLRFWAERTYSAPDEEDLPAEAPETDSY